MKNELLKQIRINKEIYSFYKDNDSIVCYTPENCLGYPDIVLLTKVSSVQQMINLNKYGETKTIQAYTLHRYMPKWKLEKIENHLIKLYDKYNLTV